MTGTCISCGRPLDRRLSGVRDPQSFEEFAIVGCSRCRLGRTDPVPADLSSYYGAAYYGKRHSFTDAYCRARRLRILERASRGARVEVTPRRVLDIGCGDGSFLLGAQSHGWRVAGTEIGAAAEASRAAGLDVRASPRDFEGKFDVVTMWHTLEHFTDPTAMLEAARDRIADDGRFIVAVPDAAGLQASLFRRFWFHLDVPRHLFHFSRAALTSLLERAGFRVERFHHVEIELDLFGWIQSALNAVLPTPNVLFHSLTGKPISAAARGELLASYALGTAIAPAALAATALGTAARRGGTLIAIGVAVPRKALGAT
jgi:SAM-dependent methyltransferase